ncbi:MAG: mycothiol synthase [Verrucomicrobiales bacterium]
MEFLVEHKDGPTPVVHLTFEVGESLTALTDALALAANAGDDAEIWVHGTTPERTTALEASGMRSNRTLLQMRCPLPTPSTDLATRAFTEDDINDFVEVNNRAFHWHPEQSGLTPDAVRVDMANDWFSADGFRLHHIDGRLAGFCWTKIHTDPEPLGEIYVIAVDPDFHGRRLGTALTLSGLDWLSDQGLTTGMLYVESDNEAAIATYKKIGFETFRTDTLWERS